MSNFSKKDLQGFFIIGGVVLIFAALIIIAFVLQSNQVKVDAAFCPTEQTYAHTLVLIDDTETLSLGQIAAVQRYMKEIPNNLETKEKLSLHMLYESAEGNLASIFSLCNPKIKEGKCNELYQNCDKIKKEYEQEFSGVLEENLQRLYGIGENPTSPIMEVIYKLSSLPDFGSGYDDKMRLIIFSDMMQNSDRYSHYKNIDFGQCSGNSYCQGAIPSLRNAEVIIYYIERPKFQAIQGREHIYFWEQYFRAGGARITRVVPVI